ncbi:hypothetical protein SLE2022_357480 [Rubroshorea leprosula]
MLGHQQTKCCYNLIKAVLQVAKADSHVVEQQMFPRMILLHSRTPTKLMIAPSSIPDSNDSQNSTLPSLLSSPPQSVGLHFDFSSSRQVGLRGSPQSSG